jgi:hypothetical protein
LELLTFEYETIWLFVMADDWNYGEQVGSGVLMSK